MIFMRLGLATATLFCLSSCGGDSPPPPTGTPTSAPAPSPAPTPPPKAAENLQPIEYLHFYLGPEGSQPNGPPLQASDGNFYASTKVGGENDCRFSSTIISCGVVTKVTPNGEASVLHAFDYTSDGGFNPNGRLIEGPEGDLYGVTTRGGAYDSGTIFKLSLDGTFKVIHSFGETAARFSGGNTFTLGADGYFYGTTTVGGDDDCGTIYRLSPDGMMTILYSFCQTPTDGIQPNGDPFVANDGTLYGTTHIGGEHGRGTIFRLSTDGQLTTLHNFGPSSSDALGSQGGLIQGPDGALYGATASGGGGACPYGCGTIYRITTTGDFSIVYGFGTDQSVNGVGPARYLTFGEDGYIYGTTRTGGPGRGTVFRLSLDGYLTTIFAFGPLQKRPYDPETGVVLGNDGHLYGFTNYNDGDGTGIFKLGFGTFYRIKLN